MAASDDISSSSIERFDAPGTPVFHERPSSSPSLAEQLFENAGGMAETPSVEVTSSAFSWGSQDALDDEIRAGAILASEDFSWDFDTPNPGVVSDEIDRRIDEALALAEKMSALGSPSTADCVRLSEGHSPLDLDDLDLPAFLRMGVDGRQGG